MLTRAPNECKPFERNAVAKEISNLDRAKTPGPGNGSDGQNSFP